jgi:hypothetical protein
MRSILHRLALLHFAFGAALFAALFAAQVARSAR